MFSVRTGALEIEREVEEVNEAVAELKVGTLIEGLVILTQEELDQVEEFLDETDEDAAEDSEDADDSEADGSEE